MTIFNTRQKLPRPLFCILTIMLLYGCGNAFAGTSLRFGPTLTDSTIHTKPHQHPNFVGGADALQTFINKNLKYPPQMLQRQYEGKVTVQFIVEKDGSLSDIQALRGPGRGSLEEAVRVVKLFPKWQPGLDKDGQVIRVQHQLPIVFKLKPGDIREDEGVMKISTY